MRNILTALLCGAMILSSAVCFAVINDNKMAIGGMMPGISAEDLVSTFGQPTIKDGDEWTYKNFKVEVERGVVTEVSTCSVTITTYDGVRVGLAAEELNSTFGKADKVDKERDRVEYEYYSTDRTKKIKFKVVNGFISKITCKLVN
ncbi:MAG: hypothetical protein IK120_02210 [Muribaculaceae bacterium]|nr:hypothetical protein [Muribaculaceae bacterium]